MIKKNSGILLCAPNSIYKNYCFEDWILNAKRFGCNIFIADNSPNNSNADLYKKHKVDYCWINPENKNTYQFICESQNAIRAYFLAGNYTHLFFLETDLFPPKSILPLMQSFGEPVVTTPYFIFKGRHSTLMNQEVRLFDTVGQKGEICKEAYTRNQTLEENFFHFDGKLKRCYASGFGCTLIERWVMEKIKFRIDGVSVTGEAHADSFFYADLQMNRIPAYIYTGLIVRHYNSDWGKLLYNNNLK